MKTREREGDGRMKTRERARGWKSENEREGGWKNENERETERWGMED